MKKDVSAILSSGSSKQRVLVLTEDIARRKFNSSPILTDEQVDSLLASFRTPNDLRVYKKFKQIDNRITDAIVNLQGLTFEVKMHFSNLRGYILVWNTLESTESMVNSILNEIKDPKERFEIAAKASKDANFLFSKAIPDEEGYIDISIDLQNEEDNHSLWSVMNNVKKTATSSIVKFISWKAAILDYMKETGFDIQSYKDELEKLSDQVNTPIIAWTKNPVSPDKISGASAAPGGNDLKAKYSITPNVSELEVDGTIYRWFKSNFLENA